MPQNNPCVTNGLLPPDIYTANLASQLTYPINFNFAAEADVVVFREQPAGTYTLLTNSAATGASPPNYTINQGVSPELVTFAAGEAPGGVSLIVGRRTDICDPASDYQVGAAIRAEDLNADFTRMLHLIQELRSTLGFMINGDDTTPIIPGTGMDLGDLDDVTLADPTPNPSLLRYDGTEWVNNDVIESSDAWVSNDTSFATTAAGDQRWLNSDASDITGGPGIDVTAAANVVTIAADLTANGGLEFSGAGNAQEIRVDQGTGVVVNANGVSAGITTIDVVNGPNNPDIQLTETLDGTATTTDIGIIGGTGVNVTSSGDDITIAADATETVTQITAGTNITISPATGVGNVTINATGGGGGGGDAETVANCVALNTAAAVPPSDGDLFLVLDSSDMTAAAGAAPGNTTAINNLPETKVTGQPIGGYGNTIQVTVEWDATNTRWQFIRWAPANPDLRYINAVDGTVNTAPDRQSIRFNGLDLIGTLNGNTPVIGYEMRFNPTGVPLFQINAGGVSSGTNAEAATFQLSFGDQSAAGNTHGIFMSAGDRLNRHGNINFTGTSTGNQTILAYTDRGGRAWNLDANGDFDTVGNIEFANGRPAAGFNRFVAGITATPTANYTLTLPPAGPTANNRILQSDSSGNLSWIATPSSGTSLWESSGNFLRPVADDDGVQIRNGANTTITLNREGGAVFNENSGDAANCDFRIESDDNQRMFFMNASLDAILIGNANNTNNPETVLDIIGGVRNRENNIGASWDLDLGNMWTVGGTTAVPNPTNMEEGMSGVIVVTTTTVTWPVAGGATIQYANNTPPNITAVPAVIPFYCDSDATILLGTPTQGIT